MSTPAKPPATNERSSGGPWIIGQEPELLAYLEKLQRHLKGRRAVQIRLSLLQPTNRREHHVRTAANTFETLVRQVKGQLFKLASQDLIFIFKETALGEVESAIAKVRFLFSDDPLLVGDEQVGGLSFIQWFLMERDHGVLAETAERSFAEEQTRQTQEMTRGQPSVAEPRRQAPTEPLTPPLLAKVVDTLASADLSNMLRRQAVCVMIERAEPRTLFHELYISIADLRETLLPGINLASSPWLFQHLTETLDRRVLALLNKHDDRTVAGDISINLNIQTLLSPEFLVFDDNVKASMRGTIIIELQAVDIFADLGAFLFARDFAHDRGYRICIDGARLESLPFLERDRLGVDMIKVVWDNGLVDGRLPDGSSLEDYVRHCGPSRIILCRCDTMDAVTFGARIGLTMFQGRHVEAALAASHARKKGLDNRRRIKR